MKLERVTQTTNGDKIVATIYPLGAVIRFVYYHTTAKNFLVCLRVKAFVNARTKSRATLKTYRVVHATWNQVVTVVQGSAEPH